MKALIVDDEKHVRDAIKMLVPWENWQIDTLLEAADGQTAMEIIEREQPELIFTDMRMPIRSGVDLLRWMYERGTTGKTIVISGYDDFELARSTLRYGGMDYILKPIDPDALTQAVASAVSEWQREEEGRQSAVKRGVELNRLMPFYWDKLFSELIEGAAASKQLVEDLEAGIGLPAGSREVRLALLTLEGLHQAHLRSFAANEELLYFSIMNICNEILGEEKLGYAFSYWNQRREIVLVLWRDQSQPQRLIERIQQSCAKALRLPLHIGLGQLSVFPRELRKAYEEARRALQQRNLLEQNVWIHPLEPDDSGTWGAAHLSDAEEKLRIAIFGGQSAAIQQAVQEWVNTAVKPGKITPEQLEMWGSEYMILRAQWAKEWLGEEEPALRMSSDQRPFEVQIESDGIFSIQNWCERLASDLIAFAKELHTLKQHKGSIIHQIRKYIELHLQEELSLQDIAQQFFLSREYISRKFKQELGENLSDYIGRIRIERAQKLLGNLNLRIAQVANMVGYQDEKYFSKVFKKYTGQTPNEFRKGEASDTTG